MSNPAPTLNQINAFNATQGTTIDFNIIGGTEVIRSNKIYIYDLSDNSLICTHLYVSTESMHELPPNTSSSIVYASGKSSADFTNNTQYYAQIQTFTDVGGTQGGSGLSIAKLFWCLPTPTLTLSTIPTTISTTSYNVSATYTPNTSGGATNEIQEFQFNLYSAIGALLQTSGVVLYGEGVDLSYNFSGLEVDSTYYVTLDVTTTQGMNVSAQSNTFTVSIDTPTMGSASVVNNGCDGYISVTSNLSSEYEHEESAEAGEIMSFTTDSVNDITELDVDFEPVQDDTPWMSAQDTTPYMFRPVPTQTEDFGHESDCIVGGTVGWNQKVQISNIRASITKHGVTFTSNNDGSITLSGTATGTGAVEITYSIPMQENHKYLLYSPNLSNTLKLYDGYSGDGIALNGGGIITFGRASAGSYLYALVYSDNTYTQKITPTLIDLTAYFGSTIADYVYTLEQGTTGAGVAWLRKYEPQLFKYNAYDAGSLVSVSGLTSHDMVGFNQWDEVWEVGGISDSTGEPISSQAVRTKNYNKCLPNTVYYGKYGGGGSLVIDWYDYDKAFILAETITNTTRTSPINAYYFKLRTTTQYGTTYNHDICVNLSDASLNGTYKPHVKHSYPLDNTLTLRGIPKLDNGKLYYDGDRYNADGSVDRRYAVVDLGSLSWSKNGDENVYYATLRNGKNANDINAITDASYTYIPRTQTSTDKIFKIVSASTTSMAYFRNDSTSTVADFVNTINGTTIVYELATPTTETADPYTNPQIVDPSGTEEYVGSLIPVGHKTTYQRICPINGWDSVEVDVVGKNILSIPEMTHSSTGVTIIATSEPKLTFNGTRSGSATVVNIATGQSLPAGTYILNGGESGDSIGFQVYNVTQNSAYRDTSGNGISFTVNEDDLLNYRVYISANTTATNMVRYPMIRLASISDATYEPYNGTTYTSTFPKYKQQVAQDKIPYVTKNIGDTYADTLTENLVGGTIAWNQSVPDTTTTHTISGSIASMDDAVAGNFESVVCDIKPQQDLHGYDKPWVGGAGENLLPNRPSYTYEGITYTRNADGSITVNGTATNLSTYNLFATNVANLTPGQTYHMRMVGYNDSDMWMQFYSNGVWVAEAYGTTDKEFTVPSNSTSNYARLRVGQGTTINNVTVYPMVSKTTITEWEPYENLCPITGWTGCDVNVSGKNLYGGTYLNYWYLPLPQGTTVRARSDTTTRIEYCRADKTAIDYWTLQESNGYKKEFTLNEDTTYFRFYHSNSANCQITLANESWDYEPFGQNYSVSWQTEAGTVYGGTVDLVTGVLTVTHGYVDLGTLAWEKSTAGTSVFYADITGIQIGTSGQMSQLMCSNYPVGRTVNGAVDAYSVGDKYVTKSYNSSYATRIYIVDSTYSTAAEFKTTMNGVQLVYELATPTTYQLDPVQVACLLGQNNVWNNIANTTVTYPTNHSYQSLSTTHKYYERINGVESISVGSDVVANVGTDNIIDLTQMFGTTIADYIYNREQSSSSGMGVKFFKSLFPNDDYDYNSGELISVNASAHVIKDANGNVLHTYPLDSDLVLRGIPKLDANNKLYYDGDVYEPSGSVTRKYGIVDLGTLTWTYDSQSTRFYTNDIQSTTKKPADNYVVCNIVCAKYQTVSLNTLWNSTTGVIAVSTAGSVSVRDIAYTSGLAFKTAMSGVYLVYELATPTTEQADQFEENQTIISNGIEEYVVTEQGDVEMPVGHDSTYYATEVYGGTIDMASGVLTIDRKIVDMGSLNWVYVSNGNYFYAIISDKAKGFDNIKCSAYEVASQAGVANLQNGQIVGGMNDTAVYVKDSRYTDAISFKASVSGYQLVYELETPIEISLTPQQMQTLSGQNNIWSNTNGDMYLVYQLPITSLLVKRRDVADVSGKWLTLYSTPITQASDMDFTFIDFLNQYGKTYQYALVPVLAQDQSGVVVQIEGGYTVSDNVDSIFDGVYIADQTNVERVKAGVGYGNIDMNQGVGSITPIGSKYPIVITNSQNQYHNGSIRGTIVPNDFYSNGNLSRMDMVNKRDELEQFLTNKRAKIIKDWNGKMWLVMIMSNVSCSFDDNYGMGMVSFSADWLEVGDPTNQQDLYNAGLINVGGV